MALEGRDPKPHKLRGITTLPFQQNAPKTAHFCAVSGQYSAATPRCKKKMGGNEVLSDSRVVSGRAWHPTPSRQNRSIERKILDSVLWFQQRNQPKPLQRSGF